MPRGLILLACLALATPATAGAEAPRPSASASAKPTTTPTAGEADGPPPSAYDLEQHRGQLPADWHDEGRSMGMQMVRSMLALLLVIGLIYVGGRVLGPRLLPHVPRQRGNHLNVLDRVVLDGKHALYVVEVADQGRLVLATGEAGVQLLGHHPTAAQPAFVPPPRPADGASDAP